MNRIFNIAATSLIISFLSGVAAANHSSVSYSQNPFTISSTVVQPASTFMHLAKKEKDVSKTVIKTKKDGTIVVKEKHKTNDGEGNKSTTTSTTTIPPSNLSR